MFSFLTLAAALILTGCQVGPSDSSSGHLSEDSSSSINVTPTPWTVTFDLNHEGAPILDPIMAVDGGKITAPSFNFTPSEDTFLGWFKDCESLVPWSFSEDKIWADRTLFGGWQSILDGHGDSENPGDSEDEYDYYDPDFYPTVFAITFDANYENGPVLVKQVAENTTAQAPLFARTGFSLSGFFDQREGGLKFDFTTLISGPLTLYAHWQALVPFTVTLNLNYADAPAPTTVTAYEGLRLPRVNAPTRDQYDFIGWCKDAAGTQPWNFATEVVNGDITLYAKWSRLPLPGVYVIVSDLWAEDQATFILWCGAQTTNKNGISTGVPNEYYFDNPGTNYLALKRIVNASLAVQVHSIAPSGGFGTTWNQILVRPTTPKSGPEMNASGGAYVDLQIRDNSVDENLTTYTVTFDLNYAGAPSATTKIVLSGQKVSAPNAPTRSGYTFSGWYLSQEGSSAFDFNSAIIADTHLYAQWTARPDPVAVTISYDSNYSGAPAPVQATGYLGETLTAPTGITRSGYVISGWYREATLVTLWNFASDLVTGAMTLYAKWTAQSTSRTDGVYVLVNDLWAADNATFELYYSVLPSGGVQTKTGVATGVTNEYFFEQILGSGPVILRRKVNGSQVAQIYNIATWASSGHDYRDFGTGWNRITLASSLAGNIANQAASSAVLTLELRPNVPVSAAPIVPTLCRRQEGFSYAFK